MARATVKRACRQPGSERNLRRNPQVALALDSAASGQHLVLAEGRAQLGAAGAAKRIAPLFASKYAAMLGSESSLEQWRDRWPWCRAAPVECCCRDGSG